jgi:hypothetical protein
VKIQSHTLVLTRELVGVKVNDSSGGVGPVFRIPASSHVRPVHPSRMSGMVVVDWQGERYAVFDEDLRERATTDSPAYAEKLRTA